jgi:hypothetical protein
VLLELKVYESNTKIETLERSYDKLKRDYREL